VLCNGRGSCEDGLLNYTCHCQPVYYGKDCENRKYNEYRVNATQFVQVLHLGLRRLDTMRISFIPRNRVGHNDTNIKYLSCTLQQKYEITGMNKEELPKG